LTNVGRIVSHVPVSFPLEMVRFFKTSHSRDISLKVDSYSSTFRWLQAWMTAVPGTGLSLLTATWTEGLLPSKSTNQMRTNQSANFVVDLSRSDRVGDR
jgi:hypothetical protein